MPKMKLHDLIVVYGYFFHSVKNTAEHTRKHVKTQEKYGDSHEPRVLSRKTSRNFGVVSCFRQQH